MAVVDALTAELTLVGTAVTVGPAVGPEVDAAPTELAWPDASLGAGFGLQPARITSTASAAATKRHRLGEFSAGRAGTVPETMTLRAAGGVDPRHRPEPRTRAST